MSLQEPLRFEPLFFERVWGGRALEPFIGGELPVEGPVGEVWGLADRDGTCSVVASGTFEGRTLRGLMLSERDALLGNASASVDDYFPLLVKLLDARANLSVQVHPDGPASARLGANTAPKKNGALFCSAAQFT